MSQYRYTLEPYISQKNRYECPSCGKKHAFTRYIDLLKKEYVAVEVGKCNREQKCGYHLSPKEYFENQETFAGGNAHAIEAVEASVLKQVVLKAKQDKLPTSFIDQDLFLKSLHTTKPNNFLSFLQMFMNPEAVTEIREKYRFGTSGKWNGATIFWQIDDYGRVRTGKMMLYDKNTGRKSKVNWVHSILKLPDYNLKQCLFGLHLLNSDKQKAIALVESEKTAVIASVAFPEFIWMATGGLRNLKASMLIPLANRKVILFPDAGCYDSWNHKVADLPTNIQYMISELIEKNSTSKEKENGFDLADYIIPIWLKRKDTLGD